MYRKDRKKREKRSTAVVFVVMKKFIGKIARSSEPGHGLVLNEEQEAWFRKVFPINENMRIAEAMGISVCSVRRFGILYGLSKSAYGLRIMKERQVKAMVISNTKNGCYDRKRGHKPSDATMEGIRKRWEEEHAGLRENGFERMKREDPERYKAICKKRSESRKELVRKEYRRVLYGLERKTKLKSIVMRPYKISQVHHRRSALERGYILADDFSEGSPYRYVIFYDKETIRSERFEENCIKDGFTIMRYEAKRDTRDNADSFGE